MTEVQPDNAGVDSSTVMPPAAKRNAGSGFLLLTFLISVIAIAGVAYFYFFASKQQQQSAQLQSSVASLQQQINDYAQVNAQLQDQSQQQQQFSQQLQKGLNALTEQLLEQKNRLQQISEIDRSDWQLAEADYLLQLASQRLLLMRDTAGIADLLQSVDQILMAIDDDKLFVVRKQLAEELTAVRISQDVDRQGLYLRIAAVAKQAERLPILLPDNDIFEAETKTKEPAENAGWVDNLFGGLKEALHKLGAYIRVHHRDAPLPATLAPEQESLVRRSLQLQFEQAQFALLAANQTLYTMSLQKARDWLFDLYLADRQATNNLVKEIDELLKQPVVQNLPKLGATHDLLKLHIENRHRTQGNSSEKSKASTPAEAELPNGAEQ